MSLDVKVKLLHPDAEVPSYAREGDAGLDFTSVARHIYNDYIEYHTGIALEIPEGYVGLLFPRSSVTNREMILKNCVGVVDSSYRGEITFRYYAYNGQYSHKLYYVGDRVGQLIVLPYPKVNLIEVEELSQTARGTGGYGSTGV